MLRTESSRMLNGQINVFPNELNFDGERVQVVQLKAIPRP